MKKDQLKQIAAAAGKLPPAKGRALLGALAAKAGKAKSREQFLAEAASAMEAGMAGAMATALEAWAEQQFPKA